jgi:hypothetical protein
MHPVLDDLAFGNSLSEGGVCYLLLCRSVAGVNRGQCFPKGNLGCDTGQPLSCCQRSGKRLRGPPARWNTCSAAHLARGPAHRPDAR